jgi:hypothetical protein
VLASATTDVNGNYSFTGVGGGSCQVAEVVLANWVQTQPLYPTFYSFMTKSGTTQQSQVISLSGVSQSAALAVSYSQGRQPVVNQSSPSVVDAVIGLGTSNGTSTSTSNGSSSDDALTTLAKSLISGTRNS